MPTPFGVVWSGVAPDHPETKVKKVFQFFASSRFCNNYNWITSTLCINIKAIWKVHKTAINLCLQTNKLWIMLEI